MAKLNAAIYGLVVLALSQYAAAQTVHVVGDSQGWTVGGPDLYVRWATGKTFAVGDALTFNFATNEHDVLRVPRASFDACSESNGIGDIISTGPVNITLEAAGEHYYICTVGRHCAAGQKLAITVSGTPGASPPNATPTPPATPTTPTTPSPTSNTPDACAPTPVASTAPGSQAPTIATDPLTPGSSSSKVLAGGLLSFGAIVMALLF